MYQISIQVGLFELNLIKLKV